MRWVVIGGCSIFIGNMVSKVQCILMLAFVVGSVWGNPVFYHEPESRPLAAMTELTSRLAARAQREQDARLPLPTPQDLEAIKKVAQILIMLGQQVIPTIIGEPQSPLISTCEPPVEDVPNDVVNTSA